MTPPLRSDSKMVMCKMIFYKLNTERLLNYLQLLYQYLMRSVMAQGHSLW